jgi:O-methyltransferase
MDNFFICGLEKNSLVLRSINRGLRFLKLGYHLHRRPDPVADMTTVEQRINYFHLLDGVIANGIAGDVVELGCFTGQCAMLFQKVIQMHESDKKLHVFDNFESTFRVKENVEDVLINNFKSAGLNRPFIHKGDFEKTLPMQLPDHIAFVHIDCGVGGDFLKHKQVVIDCLKSVYPRMTKNAIGVLMDYQDKSISSLGFNPNPGVKLACDEFFESKPEKIVALYGGQYYHGFFRKA